MIILLKMKRFTICCDQCTKDATFITYKNDIVGFKCGKHQPLDHDQVAENLTDAYNLITEYKEREKRHVEERGTSKQNGNDLDHAG